MTVYDVAISYASEDNGYAEPLDAELGKRGLQTFHYRKPEAMVALWGQDLTSSLGRVYGSQSRCCVLLVSRAYIAKRYTMLEMARARRALPVRLDDVQLTEDYADIAFTDWPEHGARELALQVETKLEQFAREDAERQEAKRQRRKKLLIGAVGAAGTALAALLARERVDTSEENATGPIVGTWADRYGSNWDITEDAAGHVTMVGRTTDGIDVAAAGSRRRDTITAHWENGSIRGSIQAKITGGGDRIEGQYSMPGGAVGQFMLRR